MISFKPVLSARRAEQLQHPVGRKQAAFVDDQDAPVVELDPSMPFLDEELRQRKTLDIATRPRLRAVCQASAAAKIRMSRRSRL